MLFTLPHPYHYTHSLPHPCTPSQGPEHCNQCRNYYIEEVLGAGSTARVCVETCPQGTYLNTTSRQCIPCHEACLGGCTGPLPFVNRTFGCLECDRVELDREGRQVGLGEMMLKYWITLLSSLPPSSLPHPYPLPPSSLPLSLPQVTCLSTGCLPGTYSSTSTAAIGDLQSGSDVCLPCDPLCAVCTGPGILPGECIQCRYATRFSEGCVRSCNATTGEDGC